MEVMPNSGLWENKWIECDARERFNDSKMPFWNKKEKSSDSNDEGNKKIN